MSINKENDIIGSVPKSSKGALRFLRRAMMSLLLAALMELTMLLRQQTFPQMVSSNVKDRAVVRLIYKVCVLRFGGTNV